MVASISEALTNSLLKCMTKEGEIGVLEEIHKGLVEQNLGGKALTKKTSE